MIANSISHSEQRKEIDVMARSTVTLLILLLVGSSMAIAQPRDRMRGPHDRGGMRERMAEELNLTDQQKDQMKKLRLDFERNQTDIHAKIKMARLDLKELFLKESLDRTAIEKRIKAVSDLQHQAKLSHIGHWFAVNEILTPEQQNIWKEHVGERAGRMDGDFRGRRHMRLGCMLQEMRG